MGGSANSTNIGVQKWVDQLTSNTARLFPEVALVAEVEPCRLHQEHHHVHRHSDKLVVGGQSVVLGKVGERNMGLKTNCRQRTLASFPRLSLCENRNV